MKVVKQSVLEDLSVFTSLPVFTLNKLITKSNYSICNTIEDMLMSDSDYAELDIGIGTLTIRIIDDNIQYRFVPSKKLEQSIKTLLIEGKNPLTLKADKSLANKIENIYKEYI